MPNSAITLPPRSGLSALLRDVGSWQRFSLLVLAATLLASTWLAAELGGLRQAALLLTGAGLGYALHRSGFGFAGAWRALVTERRGAGLRAQLALLAVLTLAFFPLFAQETFLGQPLFDIVRPVGVSLVAGAFLFGIGAQLASACSSGSLAGLGNGKFRYLVVVIGMVAGATVGSAHFGWWETQPSWFSYSLLREWGPAAGGAGNLAIIGVIAGLSVWLEKSRYGHLPRPRRGSPQSGDHWPMAWGIAAIAVLCITTLLLAGRPWIIVTALPLWGAKFIGATGIPLDVDFWDYWAADTRIAALDSSLWADVTTIMIVGLVLGTALAAMRVGGFRLHWKMGFGETVTAAFGGCLLGYGGVVGLGCNIGGFLAGVSSGSLHGWIWLIAAFAGTITGVALLSLLQWIRCSARRSVPA